MNLENLLIKNIENITKASLLLLIDNINTNYKEFEWNYDIVLPEIFIELFNSTKNIALDLESILNYDVKKKETILLEIQELQSKHINEIFKISMYRNNVNLLSLKLSNMNTFLVNKQVEIKLDELSFSIDTYFKENDDLTKLLTYFPVITDLEIINTDLRNILKKDFEKLDLDESCIAYINLKNYLLPHNFDEYGEIFEEIATDISVTFNKTCGIMTEELFNELRNKLNAIENLCINIISDLNIIFENFNTLIILITNIENFEILFENNLVLRDLFYTSKNIFLEREKNEIIIEQFNENLATEIEKYIDDIRETTLLINKELEEKNSLTEREDAIFYGYKILYDLFYFDIETSFSTTRYLLSTYDKEYFSKKGIIKENIVDKILDEFLDELKKSDSFIKKAYFSQLFRTINYTNSKVSLKTAYLDYFKEIDDYKKVQYENLLYFLKQ
ncbi:MAG: hypothetical protein ACK5LY_00810 [Lachnospirales bacterium]